MFELSVKTNFPDLMAKLKALPSEVANKVTARALTATVQQGQTEMARAISQEYRVSVGEAKKRLDIRRASFKNGTLGLSATLMATRGAGLHGNDIRGMNLINFVSGGTPKRTKNGKMRQLAFQIKRGGGRKSIPGAFIATNRRTGGTAVFIREGKARYPIKTVTTIDVPQMFNARRINERVRAVMVERFKANFARELRAGLGGFVK